ncbi:MAG: FAD-binding oxidoreductase [Chloroflexota bacterium]
MPDATSYQLDGFEPSRVETPGSVDELSRTLANAHISGEAVVLWGGGTRMHVGNRVSRYDVAVDMTGLSQLIEYRPSDLVVIAEAGITIAELQARLAESGQRLAFDPPLPGTATLGGSMASNAVGALRSSFGGIRDLVLGMTVVQADGVVTKSGGKVVKNVTGYDLAKMHIGALGTLGAIASVALRVGPLPESSRTVAAWFGSFSQASYATMSIYNANFDPEALCLLSGPRAEKMARQLATDTGVEAPANPHLLIARVSGRPRSVERQAEEIESIVGGAMADGFNVLDGESQESVWALAEDADDTPDLTIRATFKPTEAFNFINRLRRRMSSGMSLDTVFHAGFGTVVAHWRETTGRVTDSDLTGLATFAREQASEFRVMPVVERCPLNVKSALDVFGDPGASLAVMKGLKQQFDPDYTLSPGRFIGGI